MNHGNSAEAASRPLRLGYLVPEFPGQTHSFFWREILALRELGAEVVLLSTRRPTPGSCPHAFAETAIRETQYLFPPRWSRAVLRLLVHPRRTLRAAAYIARLRETPALRRVPLLGLLLVAADLAEIAGRRELQHAHAHSCATSAHVLAICRILGGPPYSLTLHGDLPVYGVDHRSKMEGATFVRTVTEALRRQVRERVGLEDERIDVIWMGVDTDRFVPATPVAPDSRTLRLVSVTRLSLAKGHHFALRAMATAITRGSDLFYTIAGAGADRGEIEKECARLGLEQKVRFAGRVSEDEVLILLHQSDVLVLSSVGLGEAAPVAVMEAMSCGLAVICSVIGGTPDMIEDGVDGILVEQRDVEGLARAIERLAVDPDGRRRIGSAARRKAVESFDFRMSAKKFYDRIREVARLGADGEESP